MPVIGISSKPSDRNNAGVKPVGAQPPAFNREQVSADTVRLRLDDAEHRIGRDRGIDRIAAPREHLCTRLRRQRLTGGDDAVFRDDFGTADDDAHDPKYLHM